MGMVGLIGCVRGGVVNVAKGGFEKDISAESGAGDGDGEVREGEAGVGDGPGKFEVKVKDFGEVDEMFKLLVGARDSTETVIDVAEEERLNIHGEDEVLGAGELKVLEKVEGMGSVLKVGWKFLDQEEKNRVE
eukprot:g27022.t1